MPEVCNKFRLTYENQILVCWTLFTNGILYTLNKSIVGFIIIITITTIIINVSSYTVKFCKTKKQQHQYDSRSSSNNNNNNNNSSILLSTVSAVSGWPKLTLMRNVHRTTFWNWFIANKWRWNLRYHEYSKCCYSIDIHRNYKYK